MSDLRQNKQPFKIKSAQGILDTIKSLGYTPQPYTEGSSNYFIVYSHRSKTYQYFSVNDHYQAPERIYMDAFVAEDVCEVFNKELEYV